MNIVAHKIRLVGPDDTTNRRISNDFYVPVKIKPGSALGVKSAVFDVLTNIFNETFSLTASEAQFQVGLQGSTLTATAGAQSRVGIQALMTAMTDAANTSITSFADVNYDSYLDYRYQINGKKFEATHNSCDFHNPDYDNDWGVIGNTSLITNNAFRSDGTENLLLNSKAVPRASGRYRFTINHMDKFELVLTDNGDNVFFLSCGGVGDVYELDNVPLPNAYASADDDNVDIRFTGTKLNIRIRDAAGVLQEEVNSDIDLAVPVNPYFLWNIDQTSTCGVTTGNNDGLTTLNNLVLNNSYDLNFSDKLAKYLGAGTTNTFTVTQPDQVWSPADNINGDDDFTGILMIVKGIRSSGVDGSNGKGDSIIAVIDKDSVEGNNIKFKPSEMDLISLNTERETYLTQLTVELVNTVGSSPLEFGPSAYVEINIY